MSKWSFYKARSLPRVLDINSHCSWLNVVPTQARPGGGIDLNRPKKDPTVRLDTCPCITGSQGTPARLSTSPQYLTRSSSSPAVAASASLHGTSFPPFHQQAGPSTCSSSSRTQGIYLLSPSHLLRLFAPHPRRLPHPGCPTSCSAHLVARNSPAILLCPCSTVSALRQVLDIQTGLVDATAHDGQVQEAPAVPADLYWHQGEHRVRHQGLVREDTLHAG